MKLIIRNSFTAIALAAVIAFLPACDRIKQNREQFLSMANPAHAENVNTNTSTDYEHTETPKSGAAADIPARAEIPSIPSSVTSQIKEYTGYTVSFNKDNGTPNWSAWELLPDETDGAETRASKKFWQDYSVAGCLDTKDYTHSGYDRGHLCPAADMKWSAEAMHDCFSMANITPQDHSLNAGAWSTLEKKCRQWAQRDGGLLICAGPIYEAGDNTTIAGGRVRVPSAFFKVIVAPNVSSPRGIAFVYPNMSAPGNMKKLLHDNRRGGATDRFRLLPQPPRQGGGGGGEHGFVQPMERPLTL